MTCLDSIVFYFRTAFFISCRKFKKCCLLLLTPVILRFESLVNSPDNRHNSLFHCFDKSNFSQVVNFLKFLIIKSPGNQTLQSTV